jgi:hypothetical protein
MLKILTILIIPLFFASAVKNVEITSTHLSGKEASEFEIMGAVEIERVQCGISNRLQAMLKVDLSLLQVHYIALLACINFFA